MDQVKAHIVSWLNSYCARSGMNGFIVGVSGGIDSAVTSILCAETQRPVQLLNMPLRQTDIEYALAVEHINDLKGRYPNVSSEEIELSNVFGAFEAVMPFNLEKNKLSLIFTISYNQINILNP